MVLKKIFHQLKFPLHLLRRKYERTFLGRANRFALSETPTSLHIAVHREIVHLFKPRITIYDYLQTGLTFASTSLTIFLVLLVASNLPAYASQVNYLIQEKPSVIEEEETSHEEVHFLSENSGLSRLPMLTTNPQILSLPKAETPNLSLSITPPDNRIVIPKIGQNIPIKEVSPTNLLAGNWDLLEKDIQAALQNGVVHYPGTAIPGQRGNVFITGHSSYYLWEPGRYKDVFALLHNMVIGDEIIVVYNQKKYRYIIEERKVISPQDVDVLRQTNDKRLTLMTCTPIGTALNRLILIAKEVEVL